MTMDKRTRGRSGSSVSHSWRLCLSILPLVGIPFLLPSLSSPQSLSSRVCQRLRGIVAVVDASSSSSSFVIGSVTSSPLNRRRRRRYHYSRATDACPCRRHDGRRPSSRRAPIRRWASSGGTNNGYDDDGDGGKVANMAPSTNSNSNDVFDGDGDGGVSSSFARRSRDVNVVVSRRTSLAVAVRAAASGTGGLLVDIRPCPAFDKARVDATGECLDDDFRDIPSSSSSTTTTAIMMMPSSYLSIPLHYRPSLVAYTIPYRIGNSTFGAIIDTGSPFLLVPAPSEHGTCRPDYQWGCLHPADGRVTSNGLRPTTERFDGSEGRVDWMEGSFSFVLENDDYNNAGAAEQEDAPAPIASPIRSYSSPRENAKTSMQQQSTLFPRSSNMTFGIVSESLMDGPGGIFMGLVKYATNDYIRPSFLGQSDVSGFSIDLRDRRCKDGNITKEKTLTLYGPPMAASDSITTMGMRTQSDLTGALRMALPPPQNAIPLVRDLNIKYGDPTVHYVGVASKIRINGSDLIPPSMTRRKKRVYCIFDTGCSGMSVSPSLFDSRYDAARANKEKSLWGTVEIEFLSVSGRIVTLTAKRPITTPLGNNERPWGKSLDGDGIIVLGLAFLDGKRMVVDIDGSRVWFDR